MSDTMYDMGQALAREVARLEIERRALEAKIEHLRETEARLTETVRELAERVDEAR